tara:strand:- start:337 stop:672 length:336 start_codon:yes stop_codon:yes gene_type:complete
MEFKTKLSGIDVDVHLPKEKELCNTSSVVNIVWQYSVDVREWGIKDISFYATKITGEVEVEGLWDGNDSEVITLDESWDIDNYTDDIKSGYSVCPQHCEIDFKTKTITINF